MKFDHAGIVVPDLAQGRRTLFWVNEWTDEFADEGHDVTVQFGRDPSGVCYELITPLSLHSPVSRALRERVNILNHMAFLVADLEYQECEMRGRGFAPVAPPRCAKAYGGAPIQFFIAPNFLLVELIEAPGHKHHYHPIGEAYAARG